MAVQGQMIDLVAPGALDLSTSLAGAILPPAYALEADNAVIDSSGRIAARLGWTSSKVQQEHRDALVGAHRTQEQHHRLILRQFRAHQAKQMTLQLRQLCRQPLERREWKFTNVTLQGNRVALMLAVADPVEPHQVAKRMESRHPEPAVVLRQHRLQATGAQNEQRAKPRARAKEVGAARQVPARCVAMLSSLAMLAGSSRPGRQRLNT